MKKLKKISTKKIYRISFLAIFLVFISLLGWLASFFNEYVYRAINIDSDYLLSQRKTAQENLDTQGLNEVLDVIKNKSQEREIQEINNIFD